MKKKIDFAVSLCVGYSIFVAIGVAHAATITDSYFYIENKRNADGSTSEQMYLGIATDPREISGTASASWSTVSFSEGGTLPAYSSRHPDGELKAEFGILIPGSDALARQDLRFSLSDQNGTDTVFESAIVPASQKLRYPPLVQNVRIGSGTTPTVSWTNPGTASDLASLGVDYIRARIIDNRPNLFDIPYAAVTANLSQNSIQLPDISGFSNPTVRIELVDAEGDLIPVSGGRAEQITDLGSDSKVLSSFVTLNELPFFDQRRSNYEKEFEVSEDEAKIYVLLDFDGEVGAGFRVKDTLIGGEALEVVDGGTHPKAEFTVDQQKFLTEKVEKIFKNSRMEGIVVVTDRLAIPEGKTVYEVEFGDPAPINSFSEGKAYDTGVLSGVDLFDLNKGGTVVVFPNVLLLDDVAETIAHEVGHGFGLIHTNDTDIFGGSTTSVMQTPEIISSPDATSFLGVPARGSDLLFNALTQNAQFATRYFALDESYRDLVAEYGALGIGSVDVLGIGSDPAISVVRFAGMKAFETFFGPSFREKTEFFLKTSTGGSEGTFLHSLNSLWTDDGALAFEIWDIFEYSIVGSSSQGGMIDLAFGIKGDEGIKTQLFNSDLVADKLTLFDFSGEAPLALFKVDVDVEGGLFPPAVVPLPAGSVLILTGLAGLAALRRRRNR